MEEIRGESELEYEERFRCARARPNHQAGRKFCRFVRDIKGREDLWFLGRGQKSGGG